MNLYIGSRPAVKTFHHQRRQRISISDFTEQERKVNKNNKNVKVFSDRLADYNTHRFILHMHEY